MHGRLANRGNVDGAAARREFWRRLLEDARAIPGVTAAGLTSNVPFNGMVSSGSYSIVGYTPGPSEAAPHGRQEIVGGDYFRAMQIPLVSGRLFADTDSGDSPLVVIIDEYLVNRYFRDRGPIGQQIRRGGPDSPPFTIVGVVGTINSIDLGQPVEKERLYYPVSQQPRPSMALVLKTGLEPEQLVVQVRAAVQSIDPDVLSNLNDRYNGQDGALVALLVVPPLYLAITRLTSRIHGHAASSKEAESALYSRAETVIGFAMEKRQMA